METKLSLFLRNYFQMTGKKNQRGGDELLGRRTKIKSYVVEDGVELILTCGGFEAKDLRVIICGRLIHFDPMEAKASIERGVLMIHLPKSSTEFRNNVRFRVDVKDVE
nr:hypothetical protein [Tanacetum cinerariifolium]